MAGFVLLVDDDPEVRLIFREVLASSGCRVEEADNGEDALRIVAALRPDLVILDLAIPVVSGLEVLARIRSDAALASVRVAVVTGSLLDEIPGATRVLNKPIGIGDLVGLLPMTLEPTTFLEA